MIFHCLSGMYDITLTIPPYRKRRIIPNQEQKSNLEKKKRKKAKKKRNQQNKKQRVEKSSWFLVVFVSQIAKYSFFFSFNWINLSLIESIFSMEKWMISCSDISDSDIEDIMDDYSTKIKTSAEHLIQNEFPEKALELDNLVSVWHRWISRSFPSRTALFSLFCRVQLYLSVKFPRFDRKVNYQLLKIFLRIWAMEFILIQRWMYVSISSERFSKRIKRFLVLDVISWRRKMNLLSSANDQRIDCSFLLLIIRRPFISLNNVKSFS